MRKGLCISFSILFLICLLSCTKTGIEPYEETRISMDTPVRLKAYGVNASKAVEEGFKRVDELDKLASSNKAESDVSKINSAAGKSFVKVHPEILKMIKTSIDYSRRSGGAWDITLGPIINLWGIGTDKARIPSDSEIKSRLSLVGYDKISINENENSVMLQKPEMAIDLGGIAKGFAADEVVKIYKKYNIQNGLVDLGASTIYAIGKNEEGNPWSIGIKHPRSESNSVLLGIIKISNEALSTSGDYERYFIKNGKRYHHIINPSNGYPADSGVMSDTIIIKGNTPDCNMVGDLLTTTVFVLGPKKGLQFIESLPNISCAITTKDYKVYVSSKFKERLIELNKDFKFAD